MAPTSLDCAQASASWAFALQAQLVCRQVALEALDEVRVAFVLRREPEVECLTPGAVNRDDRIAQKIALKDDFDALDLLEGQSRHVKFALPSFVADHPPVRQEASILPDREHAGGIEKLDPLLGSNDARLDQPFPIIGAEILPGDDLDRRQVTQFQSETEADDDEKDGSEGDAEVVGPLGRGPIAQVLLAAQRVIGEAAPDPLPEEIEKTKPRRYGAGPTPTAAKANEIRK